MIRAGSASQSSALDALTGLAVEQSRLPFSGVLSIQADSRTRRDQCNHIEDLLGHAVGVVEGDLVSAFQNDLDRV